MTLLLQLREAAMGCSNVDYRALMKSTADELEEAVSDLYALPETEKMVRLNGVWAKGVRVLEQMPTEGAPAPLSPPMEEPMRMAA